MKSVPTLRRKIFGSFSVLVGLYAVLGFLLVISVSISSKTTPTLLHLNYDSISASRKMGEAWTSLQFPAFAGSRPPEEWVAQFEIALGSEKRDLAEEGEGKIAQAIEQEWKQAKPKLTRPGRGEKVAGESGVTPAEFESMRSHLADLVAINEKGMFGLAQENLHLSREVMLGSLVYFVLSLGLSLLFADGLSQRLSQPLKSIAEALHRRTPFGRKLKLPEPSSLEMLILTTELSRLWERLGQTEKVNVAEVLEQRNKLEAVLESVEDGMLVLGPDGRIAHCNEWLARLVGLPKKDVQGSRWSDLPISSPNYLKLRDTLREGMPESQQVELEWTHGNAFFSARSRVIGPGGPSARSAGVLYLLHDITEKKQREKFRTEFIDLLSHELKTPIQSLGTASELLCSQKESLSEDTRLLVDTVAEDVARIRAVAQEFVQITQSRSKVMKLKLERVVVNQLLSEWIKPFVVVAKDRGVTIEVTQEGSEAIHANLDLVKFPWVISNILSNAVRFSPAGGKARVLLTDRNGHVEIRLEDDGPGVPDAEQTRMFEPFYQGVMSTTSGARGLFGIGLTIAKEVVEAHDGRIEYYRLQPHGSEFRILLPFP